MIFDGFIGPSYTLESVNVDAQRCVNMYPVRNEIGRGKNARPYYFAPTPGLNKLLTVGTGPIRLVHVDSIGRIFVVSYNEIYVITESSDVWSATLLDSNGLAGTGSAFTMDTTTGPVKAASMSFQGDGTDSSTLFVDGTKMYLFLDNGGGSSNLGDLTAFGYNAVDTAENIEWVDGFFVVNAADTNTFYSSDLQSFNFESLSFASSEGSPDILLSVKAKNRNLYMFNEKTTEVFYNSGNADFPFERVQGGFIEVGCAAKYSVASITDSIFWLGADKSGTGIVYAVEGIQPRRVSTHAIEEAIAGYADISTATAYTYQERGHNFYVLNFDEATWVYDMTTGLWHERAYLNDGAFERHRANTCAFDRGHSYNIVGDYSTNEVYFLDKDTYTDDTDPIKRLRTFPHFSSTDLNRVFCHSLQLDMETGIGLDGSVQGSDPTMVLDFSDDGGHTFSSESWVLADAGSGQIGEYSKRVIWRRLGKFRDRIFRVSMTDPVKAVWIGAHLKLTPGGH